MAQRYTQKKKDAVVAFVQQHNESNGRGGQSAAVKKFNINPITIRSWMEKAGVVPPGKTAKKRKISRKAAKKSAVAVQSSHVKKAVVPAAGGGVSANLKRMVAIQSEIQALQAEYSSLKEKI